MRQSGFYTPKNCENNLWLTRNKKRILILGGILICVAGGVLLYKYRGDMLIESEIISKNTKKYSTIIHDATSRFASPPVIKELSESAVKTHSSKLNGGKPFNIAGHIRNLPAGQKPSIEKVRIATELGIDLNSNQTLVKPYMENVA